MIDTWTLLYLVLHLRQLSDRGIRPLGGRPPRRP